MKHLVEEHQTQRDREGVACRKVEAGDDFAPRRRHAHPAGVELARDELRIGLDARQLVTVQRDSGDAAGADLQLSVKVLLLVRQLLGRGGTVGLLVFAAPDDTHDQRHAPEEDEAGGCEPEAPPRAATPRPSTHAKP